MTESVGDTEFFERILKEKSNKPTLKLYSKDKVVNLPECAPRDVLKHISEQMIAIHKADNVRNSKKVNKISGNRQSRFLNLNELPIYKEVQNHNIKFDTQCISDTELIHLVENVEENVINTDMVHDFNVSFENISSEKYIESNRNVSHIESIQENYISHDAVKEEDDTNSMLSNDEYKSLAKCSHSPSREIEKRSLYSFKYSPRSSNIEQNAKLRNNNLEIVSEQTLPDDFYQSEQNNHYVESPIQPNLVKDDVSNKRDLDHIHSVDMKCLKNVVFMSLDFKKDNNINQCDTKLEVSDHKMHSSSDNLNCLVDENHSPLSTILHSKQENKSSNLKDEIENCSIVTDNYFGENKENKLSISKGIFTEDYNSSKIQSNNFLDLGIPDNVLREKNFRTDTSKTMSNNFKNIHNISKNDNLSVTKELFSDKINYDLENRQIVLPNMLKETDIALSSQELDDIPLESNKTLYNDDMEVDYDFSNNQVNVSSAISDIKKIRHRTKHKHNIDIKDSEQNIIYTKQKHQDRTTLIKHSSDEEIIIDMLSEDASKREVQITCKKDQTKIDNNDDFVVLGKIARSNSPILCVKHTKRNSNTLPLVCDLEYFETFENIAFSLIENTEDMKTAKRIIDSQIFSNELCLYRNKHLSVDHSHITAVESQQNNNKKSNEYWNSNKNAFGDFDDSVTTINNSQANVKTEDSHNSRTDELLISHKVLSKVRDKCLTNVEINFKSPTTIEDEILFSSDEESGFIPKEEKYDFEKLPNTCVLETSTNCTSNVLDITMYSGFQTASNKSIQICTNSYIKAQNLMDINTNEKSLNELVDLIDSEMKNDDINLNKQKTREENTKSSQLDTENQELYWDCISKESKELKNVNDNTGNSCVRVTTSSDLENAGDLNSPCINSRDVVREVQKKRPFEGFMTASNKRIKVSEDALVRCKNVFIDIDEDVRSEEKVVKHIEGLDIGRLITKAGNITMGENSLGYEQYIHRGDNEILHNNKMKEITNKDTGNVDLEEANINDDLIIQEFENIEMSVEGTKDQNIINGVDETIVSPSKLETGGDKSDPLKLEHVGDTEDLFQQVNLTQIVNKCLQNKNFSGSTIEKDKISKINKIPNNNSNKNADMNNSIKENVDENRKILNCNTGVKLFEKMQFSGFKTGNNKPINISEYAYKTSKKIFNDIDSFDLKELHAEGESYSEKVKSNTETTVDLYSIKNSFTGFHTANNKPLKISEDSLQKTKNIFDDIYVIKTKVNDNKSESIKNDFDFKTFQQCNRYNGDSDNVEPPIIKIIAPFGGFQTANNQPVKISRESLKSTKDIFKDIYVMDTGDNQNNLDGHNKKEKELDSQTPDKKSVVILKEDKPKPFSKIFNNQNTDDGRDKTSGFVGFKTANNNPVAISKQALENTKNIFKDIELANMDNDIFKNNHNENKAIMSKFAGFQTANNKPVTIDKGLLNKVQHIFKDIIPPVEPDVKTGKTNIETSIYKGFQTASNKPVHVSETALKQTKDLFNDITMEDIAEHEYSIKDNKISTFKGFHTANNKPVQISNKALLKSKDMFQAFDINEDVSIISNTNAVNLKFEGFKTASNKQVNISEEALARCKAICNDLDICKDLNENNSNDILDKFSKGGNGKKSIVRNNNETLKSDDNNDILLHLNNNMCTIGINSKKETNNCLNLNNYQSTKVNIANAKKYNTDAINKDVNANFNTEDVDINTQMLNDFENTLHTEDFQESPKICKRSGSPILSCSKSKKRKKFKVPCSTTKKDFEVPTNLEEKRDMYKFHDNYKKYKHYNLKDLVNIEAELRMNNSEPSRSVNGPNHLEDIDIQTFVFRHDRNDLNKDEISMKDFKKIFENSVDKKIIPENWFENHFKIIIWKLLEYENKFPNCMKNVCRVRNVLEQIKYRYDVELYNAKRPALRRMLEKDDVPSRLIILLVAGIYVDGDRTCSVTNPTTNIELLVTDGWYAIKATVDKMLATRVCSKKIIIGTKLATCGAELLNCDQGVSPWEDISSVRLKLHGNSTRCARWHARLGYHGKAAILSTLGAVKMDGGKISKLRVYITRVYPALYVEKFEDGSTVTRSERLEHLHQMKYESERAAILEKLYEEVEKEISDKESQDSESTIGGRKKCLETGSQIAKLMRRCMDPGEFQNDLTSSQQHLLQEHNNRRREKLLEDIQKRVREKMELKGLCVNRNVIQLIKIRVVGVEEKNGVEVTKGVLSIWKPNDAILDLIREGYWIDVLNVVPTATRQSEIQLSAGRHSVFKEHIPKNDSCKRHLDIYKRQSLPISALMAQPCTEYQEIDTVGLIIDIEPNLDFDVNKHSFQNVYLTDEGRNMICLVFWGGIKKFGYTNLFEIGQIVCCVNLQKRLGNRRSPPSFRATEFSYFTKTPKYSQLRLILDDLCIKMAGVDLRKFRAECLLLKKKLNAKSINVNVNSFRRNNYIRTNNSDFQKSPFTKRLDEFNLSGLDFESTFKQSEQQDMSPKLLQRKRQISEKIAKLEMYGEPPPLKPIYIINKSKNAANNFKSPLIKNDISLVSDMSSDAAINKSNDVISIIEKESNNCNVNRKYLKMEPQRLNFSKNDNSIEEVVDPFADEFDASPPLSLD